MTLEQFTTNQNINLTLKKVQAEQLNTEQKVKELLHDLCGDTIMYRNCIFV
jgi:hypothetical protein